MLSLATDLGTGNPMEHAICSALVGVRFGQAIGLSEQQVREIYYAALLRHVGCTAEIDLTLLLLGDDPAAASQEWALLNPDKPLELITWMLKTVGSGQSLPGRLNTLARMMPLSQRQAQAQCETGLMLAEQLGFEPSVRDLLWYIYERWDGKGDPQHVAGDAIPLPMRIVHIVQDAEQFRHARGLDAALAMIQQRSGAAYDPALVAKFCPLAARLYDAVHEDTLWQDALAAEPGTPFYLTQEALDQAFLALADFIDLIAPYAMTHSRQVSELAAQAGLRYGLSAADLQTLLRAGLIHDLGKVAVPPNIWNKAGKLNNAELEKARLHP
ncbi:MAG: HD domain-containing protein, partial [Anaerolineae bacterium]|nr:HD domain-containing protein [Anaerolineae bacterium]